jgi:3-keto-disaccharide hydrolase
MMYIKINIAIFICIISFDLHTVAQAQTVVPELSGIRNFQVSNRGIGITNSNGKFFVHLDAKPGDGIAWINNTNFTSGQLEFDVKGKDVMQQSFVGIAFHGINDSTFEVIYFRPFNFQSNDTARKKHSVQYVSMPEYDWSLLRQTHPGVYENNLTKKIAPENWFHVKITVSNNSIKVYVDGDDVPSLVVKPITNNIKGKVGFWAGNNSDGDFSGLIIKNKDHD